MKGSIKPKKIWHNPSELNQKYNRLSHCINRLMILDHAWKQVTAGKEKFWKLTAVEKKTILVEVKLSVARNELIARRETIIKELNKYFDRPWIEKIEIVKALGAIHE